MNRWLGLGLLLVLAGALGLRCPQLDRLPMHNDEAVNALKIQGLWEKGSYVYDPNEYHGPTLHYFTLPLVWLSPARDFSQLSEKTLRLAPVIFGVALIVLLWLLRDGLGWPATLMAGLLTAISPAMVFYSRYFIHEMLLVCFTMVVLAAGWRYVQTRQVRWAIVAGTGVGLMYATKETFVITIGMMCLAGLATVCWGRQRHECILVFRSLWNPKHALAALIPAVVVSVLLFTSFFTNPSGVFDSVRSYMPWLHRAGGHSPHIHPFNFYLERLAFFHQGHGPVWSEGLILLLALVGALAAVTGRGLATTEIPVARFIALYTILLTLTYSAISYKTPWCMLSFLHGMILSAGIGAGALLRVFNRRWMQAAISSLLVLGAAHLVWQAWLASYVYESDRRNPYVYAQTVPDIIELVDQVKALSKLHPDGDQMLLKVMVPESDYWPLPWYLRQFKRVGWWDHLPEDPYAAVMIVGAKFCPSLDAKSKPSWTGLGIYGLRPGALMQLYVQADLWQRYMETARLKR